jgi:uncharacterized protein
MSEQDVERIRRGVEAFNRGDVETVLEGLDPEVEWHVPPIVPEKTVYRGHHGVKELLQSMQDSFDNFQIAVEEIVDAGDRVMVLAALRGRGKASGIEVETPSFGWVWTLREGKTVLVEVYPNRAETLEAVGLGP